MNTLIFNGSPRPQGDTAALIGALTERLAGDIYIVDCYRADIRPCVDCRACADTFACRVHDGMQAVYGHILAADNIVIASPIYYSNLTGPLLSVLSRLQIGHYARLRGEAGFRNRSRRGGILLSGGGLGGPEEAISMARRLLRLMGCAEIADPVMSLRTDELPALRDAAALSAAEALADFLYPSIIPKLPDLD